MDEEKAKEYQAVAAILAMDIDVLARISEDEGFAADELRKFIARLKQQKDQVITDKKYRETRFNAMAWIANIPKAGK